MAMLGTIDWIILSSYIMLTLFIGFKFSQRIESAEHYFLGG